MGSGFLIDDDSPSSVSEQDVCDEAASFATTLWAAKRFDAPSRLKLLEAVCDELSGARDKLRTQLHGEVEIAREAVHNGA